MSNRQSLYDRQRDMPLKTLNEVAIIGLGGGGSWVAITLALAGVKELVVMDNDVIEESNLNRTLYRYSDIGKPKTQAIKELIAERRPECIVTCINNTSLKSFEDTSAGLSTEFLDVLKCKIVIDATDNYQTRDMFAHLYQKEKIKPLYCKLGYDGLDYELDFTFCHIEDSAIQGYRRVNTYVGTVMSEVSHLLHILFADMGSNNSKRPYVLKGNGLEDIYIHWKEQKDWQPSLIVAIDGVDYYLKPFSDEAKIGDKVYIDIDPEDNDDTKTRLNYGWNYRMESLCRTVMELDHTFDVTLMNKNRVYFKDSTWHRDDIFMVGEPVPEKSAPVEITNKTFDYEIIEEEENVPEDTLVMAQVAEVGRDMPDISGEDTINLSTVEPRT